MHSSLGVTGRSWGTPFLPFNPELEDENNISPGEKKQNPHPNPAAVIESSQKNYNLNLLYGVSVCPTKPVLKEELDLELNSPT